VAAANSKALSERDICTKFITPALTHAKWDLMDQIREEVPFTKGRVFVRGQLSIRGDPKRADYILYHKPGIPIAVIEPRTIAIRSARACSKRWNTLKLWTCRQIHAYGLMRNHFHLVVETPRPNLSLGMQWLLGIYTARFKPPAQTLRPPVQRPATSIRSGLNCSNRTTRPKASA
jgi:hypothetical protein